MHHSEDPRRRAVAVSHYVDDSGSDENAVLAVVGGPVFPRNNFFTFSYDWDRALSSHGIEPPIHIKEFGPSGRFESVSHAQRRALFHDLVWLINKNKVYSLTASVRNLEFQQFFPPDKYRGVFGAAPLAFLWCVVLNRCMVKDTPKMGRMAYVAAKSHFDTQLLNCHTFFQEYDEYLGESYTGSITFDVPANVNALQAADMIVWANRRKVVGMPFKNGFEPLQLLTRSIESEERGALPHFHYEVKKESAESLAQSIEERTPLGKKITHPEWAKMLALGELPKPAKP